MFDFGKTSEKYYTYTEVMDRLKKIEDELHQDITIVTKNLAEAYRMMSGPWLYRSDEKDKDPESLAEDIRKKGREEGRQFPPIPTSDAKLPSAVEEKEISEHQRWYTDYVKMINRGHTVMVQILNRFNDQILRYYSSCRLNSAKTDNYYKVYINKAAEKLNPEKRLATQDPLVHPEKQFLNRLNKFMDFRELHNLDRLPAYDSILSIFIILFITIVFEAIINAGFYSEASGGGLLDGAMMAGLISAGICIFGCGVGFFARYFNAKTMSNIGKNIRLFFFILFVIIEVSLLDGVCIYRDVLISIPDGVGARAEIITRFKNFDIIPHNDIGKGVALFFINLVAAVFSGYEGYFGRDSVPDYADKAEELANERRNYKNSIAEETQRIGLTEKDKQIDKILAPSKDEIYSILGQYKKGCSNLEELAVFANQEIDRVSENCNRNLEAYREANKEMRATHNPPPLYFDTFPKFSNIKLQSYVAKPVDDIDVHAVESALTDHSKEAINQINERHNELLMERIRSHEIQSERDKYEINKNDIEDAEEK